MKKFKFIIAALCLVVGFSTALGGVSALNSRAAEQTEAANAARELVMDEGAAVRKGADKQGIRFNAAISKTAYDVLAAAGAQFGMLIVPKDYVTEGYELTAENVFGENAVYVKNVKASEVPDGKKAIIDIPTPTITLEDETYKIYGSIVGLLTKNIARGFIGRAYVCVGGEYYLADYADGKVENNTRSMAYVAKRAIDNGDALSETLKNTYLDVIKDIDYSYTINKTLIDFDGTVTTEKLTDGTAKFGEAVAYRADPVFGYNGEDLSTALYMQNAEFSVTYTAVPVTVAVDSDANTTEIYAAEELAAYIGQVTGKKVEVGQTVNGGNGVIFVSTDETLNLNSDSFKIYTDDSGNVHINGTDDRGTLYGVYEFEESYLGIKFLTEKDTYVPVTGKQISGNVVEKTYVPSFKYRAYMNIGLGETTDENVKYSSHLRFISQFSNERKQTELTDKVKYDMPFMATSWLKASHSIITYAAIGAYQSGVTDILDYAVGSDGLLTKCSFNDSATNKYSSVFDTSGNILDVCYSDSTAKDWVVKGLTYAIDNYPDMEYFMLGQADKRTDCSCNTCKRVRRRGGNKSYLIADFVKDVVKTVNAKGEKYSSKKIAMFAYQDTEEAPAIPTLGSKLTDMPSNVYIQWAHVDSDRYSPVSLDNINGWKEKLNMTDGRFMIWSYEVDFSGYFTYYPTMQNWVKNFGSYKTLGADVVIMQSTYNTSGVADTYLEAYVASKLLWNFEANSEAEMNALVERYKNEFIEYYYGTDAEADVKKYYSEFDALYQTKFANGGYKTQSNWTFTESELDGLLEILDKAISAATDSTYRQRLEMLALTPRYMLVKYCYKTDETLKDDISRVAARSREGYLVADDTVLSGSTQSFTNGYATIFDVEYDSEKRITKMSLNIPQGEEWSNKAPKFTAEYVAKLFADGIRTVKAKATSTVDKGTFIFRCPGQQDLSASMERTLILSTGEEEIKFSFVDINKGMTVGNTLTIEFSYYTEDEKALEEAGLTVKNGVDFAVSGNEYTFSNTVGSDSVRIFDEKVNEWISAGYCAVSLNVKFTPSADITKVVVLNGWKVSEAVKLYIDESGNATYTVKLIADTPISIWAQKGDNFSASAFTISNIELKNHDLTMTYDDNNHTTACKHEGCDYSVVEAHELYTENVAIGLNKHTCSVCGYSANDEVEVGELDFTANKFGAKAMWQVDGEFTLHDGAVKSSTELGTSDGTITKDSLAYIAAASRLYEDYLPRINFAAFKKVTITFSVQAANNVWKLGLAADSVVQITDGTGKATLTFEMQGDKLVQTLTVNGMTYTKEITDESVINGDVSATFFVQDVTGRGVFYLSGFTFIKPCIEHSFGDVVVATDKITGKGTRTCTECGETEEVDCEVGDLDFTANKFGAKAMWQVNGEFTLHDGAVKSSTELSSGDGTITKDSLAYIAAASRLYEDYLPRINFAAFKKVTITFSVQAANNVWKLGLAADSVVQITDGTGKATLTFEMQGDKLVQTLTVNGMTYTKEITDESVINGDVSATFFVQDVTGRGVFYLSDFTFER